MSIARGTSSFLLSCLLAAAPLGAAPPAPPPSTTEPPLIKPPKDEAPPGSFDLRPKFHIGQDRRVRLSLDSSETKPDLTAEPDPKSNKQPSDETKTRQEFVLVFSPTKVNQDGTTEVAIVFDQIKSHVEGSGVNESFDSQKPAPNPSPKPSTSKPAQSDPLNGLGKTPTLEETLRPLVGEKLTAVFDRDGNVIDIRGGSKFVRALNPMAPEELTQVGGDQELRDLFKSIVSSPGKSFAKPGESWSTDTSLDLFPIGGSRLHTDYRLTSAQGSKGKIAFQGKVAPSKDPSPGAAGLKLTRADYSGTTDWDQEDGFARAMQSSQAIDAELKIGDQVITIKQTQKMKLERLPDTRSPGKK